MRLLSIHTEGLFFKDDVNTDFFATQRGEMTLHDLLKK